MIVSYHRFFNKGKNSYIILNININNEAIIEAIIIHISNTTVQDYYFHEIAKQVKKCNPNLTIKDYIFCD